MALSASTVLEVRQATGSDTNGIGFVTGASGTDWSQQTSPQYSVSDGVAVGTATFTSATANFGTDVVGNLISLSGGSNSLAQTWRQITARASATSITLDSSVAAGTSIVLKIGGAGATLGVANTIATVAGQIIFAKGAFTPSGTAITMTAGVSLIGYSTSRGDNGQITIDATGMTAANNTLVMVGQNVIRNISISGSKAASFVGATDTFGYNCTSTSSTTNGFSTGTWIDCLAVSSTTNGFSGVTAYNCFARSSGGMGFITCGRVVNCVAYNNTTNGFANTTASMLAINCTSYGNGGDGFLGCATAPMVLFGCVAYANTGVGYHWAALTGNAHGTNKNCYSSSTGGGVSTNLNSALDDAITTLTAQPFVDPTGTFDYTPNATAGGGLLIRNGGFGTIQGLAAASTPDAGAVQVGHVTVPSPVVRGNSWAYIG